MGNKIENINSVIYERDYLNGMHVNIPNLKEQSKFYNRTPEEKRVMNNIWERVKKIQSTIITIILFIGMTLTGCEKDFNKYTPDPLPQNEMITQKFGLDIPIKETSMSKGNFDPAIWVHPLSSEQFELKFTNQYNTYTRMVSINELRTGTISISMISGSYDISYNPVHGNRFSNVLDIKIDMKDVVINGTGIIMLNGQLDDALIIVDVPIVQKIYYNYPNLAGFTLDDKGFWWAYTNQSFTDLDLYCGVEFGDKMISISPLSLGVVYWVQTLQGQTINLDIPSMTYQTIILP